MWPSIFRYLELMSRCTFIFDRGLIGRNRIGVSGDFSEIICRFICENLETTPFFSLVVLPSVSTRISFARHANKLCNVLLPDLCHLSRISKDILWAIMSMSRVYE